MKTATLQNVRQCVNPTAEEGGERSLLPLGKVTGHPSTPGALKAAGK